jgi:hypothetical protein
MLGTPSSSDLFDRLGRNTSKVPFSTLVKQGVPVPVPKEYLGPITAAIEETVQLAATGILLT